MRVFVTGASGFIGSAVVPDLLARGHQVLALARSDASASALKAAGAEVHRGDLADLESLRAGASQAEGVIHLGFIHDFANFLASAQTDRAAVDLLGELLAGTNRPLVMASGTIGMAPGRLGTEDMPFTTSPNPRMETQIIASSFAERGVRISFVRFSPTVHGRGDHGFIARFVQIAREKGFSGYVGDGQNRWNACHRLDAAPLVSLALEKAKPGQRLHAVGEEGVATRAVAEVIGRKLGIPTRSVAPEDAAAHFGFLGTYWGIDQPVSNDITKREMGWAPTHPGLLEDLEEGHYFASQTQ